MSSAKVFTVLCENERLRSLVESVLSSEPLGSSTSENRPVVTSPPIPSAGLPNLFEWMCQAYANPSPIVIVSEGQDDQLLVTSLSNPSCSRLPIASSPDALSAFLTTALKETREETNAADARNYLSSNHEVCALCADLTPPEQEVLLLMLEGHTNRGIANRLEVSERTVENRRRRIFEVFGTHSLAILVRMVCETIGYEGVSKLIHEKRQTHH
jgi:DNA-binding NarL/FixJ family response regulator